MPTDIRLAAENLVLRFLLDLPADCPAVEVTQTRGQLAVTLRIGPASTVRGPLALTAREREILDVARQAITEAGRKLQGAELRAALRASGRRWGESTVNRTLADLVAGGHLENDHDGRGYGLPAGDR